MATKYVRDTYLAERYSVTRQCIWRWVRRGILPEPERITPGCTRFDLAKVEAAERQRQEVA